jgi:hypothetical protein
VYREVRDTPDRFASLLEKYSDHRDALRGGDVGDWSSQEPTPFYREVAVLSGLELGEVAPPFDSPFGVQIMMRTPSRARQQYATETLMRGFDSGLPDEDANSRAAVLSDLRAVLPRLAEAPQMFGRLQALYCCVGVRTWLEGRGDPVEEALLSQLTPGQFGQQLIVQDGRASIVKRVETAHTNREPVLLDLPEPSAPDVDYLVGTYGGRRMLDAIVERAVAQLALEPETAARLRQLGDHGERLERCGSEEERVAVFREYQDFVEAALGAARFEQYQRIFETYLSERLLRPRASAVFRDPESGLPFAIWPGL